MSGQVYREVMMKKKKKKMKWIFGICLAVVVCLGVNNVMAEESEIDTSVFEYEENEDGTITITDYNGTDEIVVIPSEIDGKRVISIKRFFKLSVKRVIIQEGITEIKEDAFTGGGMYSPVIETVSLPSTLKIIGDCAFERCYKLYDINLPNGLIRIGQDAFYSCYSLKKLIVPDSVIEIGTHAFDRNFITPFPIYANPNSYTKIYARNNKITFSCINHSNIIDDNEVAPTCTQNGKTAGKHCGDCDIVFIEQNPISATGHSWDIGTVTRNATVTRAGIKTYFCKACGSTKTEFIPEIPMPNKGKIISDSENISYTVTKSNSKNGTLEYIGTKSVKSSIVIPSTVKINGITYKVTSIARNAFKNNKKLKKVIIGSNIININTNAFNGCKNLKMITIKSKNLKGIGKNAFKNIKANAKIKVPKDRLAQYEKLLTKKGQKATVKITV